MAQQRTVWILVADASRARLLEDRQTKLGYKEIAQFEHPDSRARVRDLTSDANGRMPSGQSVTEHPSGLGRPGAAPDTDPKEVEAQRFASELADMLGKRLDEHAYEGLILVAPPHFLGLLRGHINAQVHKRVEGSIDKDFSMLPLHELKKRLLGQLAA